MVRNFARNTGIHSIFLSALEEHSAKMSQAIVVIQQFVSLLSCTRRSSSGARNKRNEAFELERKLRKKRTTSFETLSNDSTDLDSNPTSGHTSESEMDISSSGHLAAKRNFTAGVRGPPGLEGRAKGQGKGKDFRANAKPFFPKPSNKDCGKDDQIGEYLGEISTSSGRDAPTSLEEVLKKRLQRGPPKTDLLIAFEKWIKDMEGQGTRVTLAAYTTVIDACAKAGDMDRAEFWMKHLLDAGRKLDVVSYCAMIDACAKSGDSKKASQWHKKMQANGVRPNAHSFSAVINACSKATDLPSALQWLGEMSKAGVAADVVIYANVLDACAKVKNGELARVVFDLMISCKIRPNIVVFTSFARSFAHSGKWKEVEHIAEEMASHRVEMNDYFLCVLLIAYGRALPRRQADRAATAFLQAHQKGIRMNKHIMDALWHAVGRTRYEDLVRKCGIVGCIA